MIRLFLYALPYFCVIITTAQEIPLGTWRSHISYNDITSLAFSANNVYAASSSGLQLFNKSDNSISSFSKVNGLSSAGITCLAFDMSTNQLLIGYENGNLDILGSSGFTNYDQLKNLTTITGSKRINDIAMNNGLAFLSTDFGVVVFDLGLLEIKETFRDLGPQGERMRVFESSFYNDSIFLATEAGVLAGDLADNLLDFNNWVRFDTGDFDNSIQSIEYFNAKLYAAISGMGIYSYSNGTWTLETFLQRESFRKLNSGANLYITTQLNKLWVHAPSGTTTELVDPLIEAPNVGADDSEKQWVADSRNGLLMESAGSYSQVTLNAPTFTVASNIHYDNSSDRLYTVSGGHNLGFTPAGNSEKLNSFANGNWSSYDSYLENDLTDIAVVGSKIFLSSYGYGLQVIDGANVTIYDDTNSPLQNISTGNNIWITALVAASDGVWVANYGATQPLHFLKTDGTWQSFTVPNLASRYITDIEIDYLGNVWLALNPAQGGGLLVHNKTNGSSVYLVETVNQGGLPSRNVFSIATDRSGQMWVGTSQGVAYFPDPGRVFSGAVNSIKPIFQGRFLLRDETVTVINVDGGNRKWIGTERGVWLLDGLGESELHNFNETNSPLLSNVIHDIEIHPKTGEVFFSTDRGIVSFRADATSSGLEFETVKIFPNPVTASFNGLIGISGLSTDAIVKITDVAGKLVWQTIANGGTASWNLRDSSGRRPSTGIYLVLSTSSDGTESVVGKIAIVN